MISSTDKCKLGAIFGAGRSGTTWLGTIVSSHPKIAYRFEPFSRLRQTNTYVEETFKLIRSSTFSSSDLSQIYHTLLSAHPEWEKPPFFQKSYSIPPGRSMIWPLARKNTLFSHLFQQLYTPKATPPLVFKEVQGNLLYPLLTRTTAPVIYIMRHPCAVVWSNMQGQKNSLMPKHRRQRLSKLLEKKNPTLAEQYNGRLEKLSISEQEALLWRLDVEQALSACQVNKNGLLVIYEGLVAHPLEIASKVFNHLGLEMTRETASFIEESTQSSQASRIKRGEIGINQYFTVFRDSKVACNAWKDEMPPEDRMGAMKIVRDSNPFVFAAEQNLWN